MLRTKTSRSYCWETGRWSLLHWGAVHAAVGTLRGGRETTCRVRVDRYGRGCPDVCLAAGGGTLGHKGAPEQDATPRGQGK
jgi:hypothetical protein